MTLAATWQLSGSPSATAQTDPYTSSSTIASTTTTTAGGGGTTTTTAGGGGGGGGGGTTTTTSGGGGGGTTTTLSGGGGGGGGGTTTTLSGGGGGGGGGGTTTTTRSGPTIIIDGDVIRGCPFPANTEVRLTLNPGSQSVSGAPCTLTCPPTTAQSLGRIDPDGGFAIARTDANGCLNARFVMPAVGTGTFELCAISAGAAPACQVVRGGGATTGRGFARTGVQILVWLLVSLAAIVVGISLVRRTRTSRT